MDEYPLRVWWDTVASEQDQRILLIQAGLASDCIGVPWAFLPAEVRQVLEARYMWGGPQHMGPARVLPSNSGTEGSA